MTSSQYLIAAFLLGTGAFVAATPILKSGSAKLSEGQLAELKSMGPDPIAMLCPVVMFGAAYFSSNHPEVMVGLVTVALGVSIYRVPYRQWRMPWPLPARRGLLIGNVIMSVGLAAAALLYISQHLGRVAL